MLVQNYIYLVTVVVKKFLEFNNIHFLDSITTPKRIKSPPNFLTQKEVKQLLDSITWDEIQIVIFASLPNYGTN